MAYYPCAMEDYPAPYCVLLPFPDSAGYTAKMDKLLVSAIFIAGSLSFYFGFERPFFSPKVAWLAVLCVVLALRSGTCKPNMAWILLFLWLPSSFFLITNPMDYIHALMPWGLYFAALWVRPHEEDLARIRIGLMVSGALNCLYLFLQHMGIDFIEWEPGSGPGSFMGNANACAHFLVLAICLGQAPANWGRMALPVARGIMMIGVMLCESRGAFLALAIWAFFEMRQSAGHWRKRILATAGVLVLLLLAVNLGEIRAALHHFTHPKAWAQQFEAQPLTLGEQRALEQVLARGEVISDEQQEALAAIDPWFRGKRMSLMLRQILWGNSLLLAFDTPLTGKGLGQFHVNYPQWSRAWVPDVSMGKAYRARSAHNFVLDSLIQPGFPWFALLVWLIFGALKSLERECRLALSLQLMIALFSVNYLNPVIVTTLILFLPKPDTTANYGKIPVYLLTACVALLVALDLAQTPKPPGLIPQKWAAHYYQEDDFERGLKYQIQAWEQDPFGPETLYNLHLVAKRATDGKILAKAALVRVCRLHPGYEPARDEMARLIAGGVMSGNEPMPSHEHFGQMVDQWSRNRP